MSHGIDSNYDIVKSTKSTEWHGLAKVVDVINDEELNELCPDIIESPLSVEIDGLHIELPNNKVILADYRYVRPDLAANGHDPIIPLYVPKASYQIINNRSVVDAVNRAIAGMGFDITSAGTLEAGKKFFVSIGIGENDEFKLANGDKFHANLNFITSHDGTVALNAFDSMIRIVCMNTFKAAQSAGGDLCLKVYHTKNADLAVPNMGDVINGILKGRLEMIDTLNEIQDVTVDYETAENIIAGYFAHESAIVSKTGDIVAKLSTRSMNSVSAIADLSKNGLGNDGKSLYDVWNGVTEYYTHGGGTGSNSDEPTKAFKGIHGMPAQHKSAFLGAIKDDGHFGLAEIGREAIAFTRKAQG